MEPAKVPGRTYGLSANSPTGGQADGCEAYSIGHRRVLGAKRSVIPDGGPGRGRRRVTWASMELDDRLFGLRRIRNQDAQVLVDEFGGPVHGLPCRIDVHHPDAAAELPKSH